MKLLPIANLLIFFIITAIIQAVYIIFFLPAWTPVLSMAILTIIIFKFFLKRNWVQSLVAAIVITEASWVLLFMPSGGWRYLIHSSVLLVIFYIILDILKHQSKIEFRKIVIYDLLFGAAMIIFLFATSKWMTV